MKPENAAVGSLRDAFLKMKTTRQETGRDMLGVVDDPELAESLVNATRARFEDAPSDHALIEWRDALGAAMKLHPLWKSWQDHVDALEAAGAVRPGPVRAR